MYLSINIFIRHSRVPVKGSIGHDEVTGSQFSLVPLWPLSCRVIWTRMDFSVILEEIHWTSQPVKVSTILVTKS